MANYKLYTIILFLLFFKCANVKPPKGGPKDKKPPELIKVNPSDKTINKQPEKIEFVFNENIRTKGLYSNFYIQPYQKLDYETNITKNKLTLTIKDTLPDNKTYTLYFKNAISDKTEQNTIPELNYTFSTGPTIDTNFLKGNIKELKTNNPSVKTFVGLYEVKDSINIQSNKPVYFANTTEKGDYTIKNIRPGNYLLYAFTDENKDKLYNPRKDLIGWISDTLKIKKGENKRNLNVLKQDFLPPNIQEKKVYKNYFNITFSEETDTITYKHDFKTNSIITASKNQPNSFNFFLKKELRDTLTVILTAIDKFKNEKRDTLLIFKDKNINPENQIIKTFNPKENKIRNEQKNINISFNYPLNEINYDSIIITEDTIRLNKKELKTLSSINKHKTSWQYKVQHKPKDSIKIILKKGAFISYINDTSESIKKKYRFLDKRNFGIISGDCINIPDNHSFVIELLNVNNDVIEKTKNKSEFKFNYLQPGNYRIRGYIDINNNDKWDQGNYQKLIKPEPYFFNNKSLELKANWEIRDITLDFKN